jgi:hypothetical protein
LLWLVDHLTYAETIWVLDRFAGSVDTSSELDGPSESVSAAVAGYRSTWSRVDAVLDVADWASPCANFDAAEIPDLWWVVAHLVEETARHAGHADILRELIDGRTGR